LQHLTTHAWERYVGSFIPSSKVCVFVYFRHHVAILETSFCRCSCLCLSVFV